MFYMKEWFIITFSTKAFSIVGDVFNLILKKTRIGARDHS